ncbi:hypothetical protein [Bradyrhizobium betae]|uniref:hypothetical protein n=1 Tax=Bradyrhizobium betae TaxID=244734 RepID=UPI0013E96FB4|nr:hypothetical protein [Bradyrhizobium betae]
MINKGFSNRVATTCAAVMMLTRRAKHWHDVIVAATGSKAQALAESAPRFSG